MRQSLSENSSNSDSTDCDSTDSGGTGAGCSRRNVLQGAGLATLAVGAGLSLAACTKPGIAVRAADVPVGGGKILTEAGYVVTQPAAGQYRAFVKTCPHAGCPVSSVADGKIVCKCHGSTFSISDGSVIAGPARKGLGDATVTVSGDALTVTA
jgi:nitrite reductase/ring-hydroxylating ferredoxin subunit